MHFQSNQLLYQWVTQEIEYFKSVGQICHSYDEKQSPQDWTSLISNQFIYNLFQQIDSEYFTDEQLNKYHETDSKTQTLLKEYWFSLNRYLNTKHNKRINPNYFFLQTASKKQLTSREYSRKNNTSINNSVIDLIKLQFYLLVQKNSTNNHSDDVNDSIDQKQLERMNDTLASSSLIQEGDNDSVRGSFQYEQISGSIQSISSVDNEIQSKLIESNDDILIESKDQISTQNNIDGQFLQRICELSQQVQQYLVSVVESIQQKELLEPYQPQNSILKESFVYPPNQNSSPIQSQLSQNFKKQIYKEIQQVNEQNQQLRQKIEQLIEQNQKLQKQLQDNQQQENLLITKINNYNQQKQQLFDYLKHHNGITINSLQEFIEIVQHIQQENQLLENTIAEIQERNYELETQNAQKIHSINKNALEITKINDDITKFKTKIKDLKQDIQYLDQFVNGNNPHISAQMITSIHVAQFDSNQEEDEGGIVDNQEDHTAYQNQGSFLFNKSIDLQARHSFGNVLRENHDIYNSKVINKSNTRHSHNRVLTDSLNGCGPNRLSLQTSNKLSTHKKNHKSSFPPFDQQNIDPTPFQQDELKMQHFAQFPSKSHSHISVDYQLKEEEREIEEEKEKYKQDLVNSLEQLYKEINDLTKDVTQAKEQNKTLEKKNKLNEKKITQLKHLHDAFLKEASKV